MNPKDNPNMIHEFDAIVQRLLENEFDPTNPSNFQEAIAEMPTDKIEDTFSLSGKDGDDGVAWKRLIQISRDYWQAQAERQANIEINKE
jgi:hypothetical protein